MEKYDGFVLFESPVIIRDDLDHPNIIFGLLFEKEKLHKDDLGMWQLNRFISYLNGCVNVQSNNGEIWPDKLITSDGKEIKLTVEVKNCIYHIMKPKMMRYRIIESPEPFEINETETEDRYVISEEFLIRNVQPVIYNKSTMNHED